MQNSAIMWVVSIVLACWVIVIGHLLGWSVIDPERYGIWRSTLYIAYPVAFMSVAVLGAAVLLAVFKK